MSHPNNETEILSFGLLPEFVGLGLGKEFLSVAVECAWRQRTRRIWLSTCSLDHPRALHNYRAAGFTIFKTTEAPAKNPDRPVELWPSPADRLDEV